MAKAEYRSAVRSRKLINDALADMLIEKPLDKITVTDVVMYHHSKHLQLHYQVLSALEVSLVLHYQYH